MAKGSGAKRRISRRRIAAAKRLQGCLARRVDVSTPIPNKIRVVAGVDCAFPQRGEHVRAAAVLMTWPELTVMDEAIAEQPTPFPYIPGLLSFRELAAVRAALAGLRNTPDLILCDGQGIAHPRRLGIAAHLGITTGIPTVGVAKSRLVGEYEEPARERGSTRALMDGAERIGTVIRTRDRVKPLFVSPGHGIDHGGSVKWTLACCTRYRLPEPVRAADHKAGR